MKLLGKEAVRISRHIMVILFIVYDACLVLVPLTEERNFFTGMKEIICSVFFSQSYDTQNMTTSYATGVLTGMSIMAFMLVLALYQIFYAVRYIPNVRKMLGKNNTDSKTLKGEVNEQN